MAEVVLIRPRNTRPSENATGKESRPPAGLLYVAAPLVVRGWKVAIIDQSVYDDWEKRLRAEVRDDTVCVGITCLTGPTILNGIEAARIVRECSPCPIVWGGVHPTLEPDSTIASKSVDIMAMGEGEETLLDLVQVLRAKGDLGGVEGIIYKRDGAICRNTRRRIYDLNELPDLPLHLIDMDEYKGNVMLYKAFNITEPRAVAIETSRGCTHRCTYCVMANEGYEETCRWRGLTAHNLCDRIERIIRKHGIRAFTFVDDNFFGSITRAKEFLDEVEKRHLRIEWFADVRMDTIVRKMDVAFLKRMEKCGARSLGIGIESGSDRMLERLRKGETRATYVEANRMLAQTTIVPRYGYLQGMPYETRDDAEQTYTLVAQLLDDNPLAAHTLNKLLPTPGTPIFEDCVTLGFKKPDKLEDWAQYCDTTWREGGCVWMDEQTVDFVTTVLYYTLALAFSRPPPRPGLMKRILLKVTTSCVLFRIRHKFYSFRVGRFLTRLLMTPFMVRCLKWIDYLVSRLGRRDTGREGSKLDHGMGTE